METLLTHPKTREMFVSTYGLSDLFFEKGWRLGYQDRNVPTPVIQDYEEMGYSLVDIPKYYDFHIGE